MLLRTIAFRWSAPEVVGMRYLALATDYDGTLADDGVVSDDTWAAVKRLRESGRKVLLVTGRELDDLQRVCPAVDLFDRIVAENGGLLYNPAQREEKVAGPSPARGVCPRPHARKVAPLSIGRSIVATWRPHETAVLETIRDLGLEMHIIFNKDAVMVLPSGVNKATGLKAALDELGLSAHSVVGIGDAENDHAFLALCGCAAAVSNALPKLKERAHIVTRGDHGRGVIELIEELLADDLRSVSHSEKHRRAAPRQAEQSRGRVDQDGPLRRNRTVLPPWTVSPTLTSASATRSAGTDTSVREPNLIMPSRCPARTSSSGLSQHTIRRAMAPAICLTRTGRRSARRRGRSRTARCGRNNRRRGRRGTRRDSSAGP